MSSKEISIFSYGVQQNKTVCALLVASNRRNTGVKLL